MKQLFARLAHTTKINLGNYLRLYLDILFKQKKVRLPDYVKV